MALVCAITGLPPKEPVISPQGHVFDRMNIQNHLSATGRCPVTGDDLSEFALQPVQDIPAFIFHRSGLLARSIPAMIRLFRIEFDKRVLANLEVRREIDRVKDEIADLRRSAGSAEVVIAELLRERDEAVASLSALQNRAKRCRNK